MLVEIQCFGGQTGGGVGRHGSVPIYIYIVVVVVGRICTYMCTYVVLNKAI
jgi:hypothetical protein